MHDNLIVVIGQQHGSCQPAQQRLSAVAITECSRRSQAAANRCPSQQVTTEAALVHIASLQQSEQIKTLHMPVITLPKLA
jgi:hypothetical protein